MGDRRITLFDPNRFLNDSFFAPFMNDWGLANTNNTIEMEMYEEGDDLVVRVKAPGYKKEDIEINVEDNVLTVSGKVNATKEEENKSKKFYFKEMREEAFSRTVRLPIKVQAEKAAAAYENGVLKVTMPKADELKPKKIEIKAA